ncbi:hypothetical protein N7448_006387 [Penicillium atrosanguineum]|nr:hypothetical protein N7448_006387 [Penicillium atrosanguineum]
MSTIQNIKNFIRHGKQARLVTPHAEPTTDVSTIHAEQQPQPVGQFSPALEAFDTGDRHGQAAAPKTEHSRRDQSVEIERLVAEEKMNRSKMPKYPGLERWILVEKMGDGAFSNVYRAKDSTGQLNEVAIKVVRKFEMNSNQMQSDPLHPTVKKVPQAAEVRQKNPLDVEASGAESTPYQPHSTRASLEIPSSTTEQRRMDFRSPGAFNLREVFDVGYAVHRQEEEGKRRRDVGARSNNPTAGFQNALGALNEVYDDEPDYRAQAAGQPPQKVAKSATQQSGDMAGIDAKLRSTNLGQSSAAQARQVGRQPRQPQGYGQHDAKVAAAAKSSIGRVQQPFELTLDGATLLEKRGRRNQPVA